MTDSTSGIQVVNINAVVNLAVLDHWGSRAPGKPRFLLASVLQTASARDFPNAGALEAATRGRDLLKLAHCRTDSSPARPVRPPIWKADSRDTPPSFWALASHGGGRDAPWDYRGIPPPKDQSWGPDSIVLRLGPGVMIHQRTGSTAQWDANQVPTARGILPTRSGSRGRLAPDRGQAVTAHFGRNRRP